MCETEKWKEEREKKHIQMEKDLKDCQRKLLNKKRKAYLICGDLNWTNDQMIKAKISTLSQDTIVITRGCEGVESLAEKCAKKRNMAVQRFSTVGKPVKNAELLKFGNPDVVWAFHTNINASPVTKNLVELARTCGFNTEMIKLLDK
jgi:hypothetical protein